MPTNFSRHVVTRVAEVARRTAVQVNPIVRGTVLSRNPDGSLNVSDGRGGCVRVAPRANVRVGSQVILGTEPSLGSQTSLPQISVTLSPSNVPCPDDPRFPDGCENLVGVPCAPPTDGDFISDAATYAVEWFSLNLFEGFPGTNGVWADRLGEDPDFLPAASHLRLDANRKVTASSSRRASNYGSTFLGAAPYADRYSFVAGRAFLAFDTTDLPANAQIVSASLQTPITSNIPTRLRYDLGSSIYVVGSSHAGGASIFNFNTIDRDGAVLGTATIQAIHDAGPSPEVDDVYNFTFDLDAAAADLTAAFNAGGVTKLALVNSYDFGDSAYPPPASFSNLSNPNEVRDVVDSVLFSHTSDLKLFVRWTTGLVD